MCLSPIEINGAKVYNETHPICFNSTQACLTFSGLCPPTCTFVMHWYWLHTCFITNIWCWLLVFVLWLHWNLIKPEKGLTEQCIDNCFLLVNFFCVLVFLDRVFSVFWRGDFFIFIAFQTSGWLGALLFFCLMGTKPPPPPTWCKHAVFCYNWNVFTCCSQIQCYQVKALPWQKKKKANKSDKIRFQWDLVVNLTV